jgi:hypothetical protein
MTLFGLPTCGDEPLYEGDLPADPVSESQARASRDGREFDSEAIEYLESAAAGPAARSGWEGTCSMHWSRGPTEPGSMSPRTAPPTVHCVHRRACASPIDPRYTRARVSCPPTSTCRARAQPLNVAHTKLARSCEFVFGRTVCSAPGWPKSAN